jgi:hypothetical protein
LPGKELARRLEKGQAIEPWFPPWGWSSLALWAYRSGDPELAIKYASEAENHSSEELIHARCLGILALAQHQLHNEDAARSALAELAEIVSRQSYREVNNHDQLVPKILLQEAEAKITGKPASESGISAGPTAPPAADNSSDPRSRRVPKPLKASKPPM